MLHGYSCVVCHEREHHCDHRVLPSAFADVDLPALPGAGLVARHHAPVLPHLTSLRGAFTGLGVPYEEDEAIVDTPMALGVPDPKAPSAGLAAAGSLGSMQLGINMPALAVPVVTSGDSGSGKRSAAGSGSINARAPEEVVLCFGIIDILQVGSQGTRGAKPGIRLQQFSLQKSGLRVNRIP